MPFRPSKPRSLSTSALPRRRRALQTLSLAAFASGALLLGPSARAATNTEQDVINGQTDLFLSGTYSPAGVPTVSTDINFLNVAYSPAAFTLSGSFTTGSLNDSRNGTSLSISNTSGSAKSITLGGTGDNGDSISGVAADLLFVTNGGNLTLTGGSGTSALNLVLGQSGNFDVQGNGSLTISSVISDGGSGYGFTKTGSGTLYLGGQNTYTGATTLAQGTISLDFNSYGSVTSFINSGSALVMGGNTFTTAGAFSSGTGGAGIINASEPTLTVQGNSSNARTQTFNGLTLNAGTNQIAARTIGSTSTNLTLAFGGITHNLGGSVDFTSNGSGSTGTGVFTTTTANSNGILGGWAVIYDPATPNNSTSLQTPTDWATNNGSGSIVAYTGYNTSLASGGTIGSDGTQNYKVTPTATFTLATTNAATTDINTFEVGSASSAGTTITVGTAGTGSTGILRVGAAGGFFTASTNGSALLTIGNTAGNGTLTAGGAANTAGEITFQANQNISVNSNITDNGTGKVTVTVNAYNTPNSNTSLNLYGNDTYSGGTFINSGRVLGNTSTAFGTGAVTIAAGAQAYLNGGTYTNNFNISGGGGGVGGFDTPAALRLQGGQTLSGTITLLSDAYILGGGTDTFTGQITGGFNIYYGRSGGGGAGAGTIVLANTGTASNYTGNTTITEGTLQLGASNQIPDTSTVILSGSIGSGVFNLNGYSETINGLSGVSNATVKSSAAGASVLTVGNSNATATFAGTLSNSTGTLGITKTGTGTETFSGTNSYGGGTTVNGGTLVFSGTNSYGGVTAVNGGTLEFTTTMTGTGAVNVNGGGTLNTSGTAISIPGAVTVAGGSTTATQGAITLIGNGVATDVLTLGNAAGLTLGGTSGNSASLGFDTLYSGGTAAADKIAVTNAVTLGAGGANVLINSLGGIAAGQTYNLLTFGSGSTYNGAAFTTGSGTSVDGFTLANTNLSFGVTGTLNVTGSALQLITSGATAPNTAYWYGGFGSTWASLGNSGTAANFTTDAAGTSYLTTYPASNTDVIFAATNATNLTNTLGQGFDVKGIEFLGTGPAATTATNISDATYTLSLEGDGLKLDAGNAGVTLATKGIGLGANQTWANNSSNALTVTTASTIASNATSGTNTLTLSNTGTGTTTINGTIANGSGGGAVAVVVNNTGTGAGATTTFSGTNTYTGGTTVSSGTLSATDDANAFGTNGAGTSVSIASAGTVSITSSGGTTYSDTFTGSGRLIFNFTGGGDVTTANSSFNGFTGTIEVSDPNYFNNNKLQITGQTGVSGATLQIDSNGQVFVTSGTTNFGAITVVGSGQSENRGAIRLNNGTLGGNITLLGNTTVGNEGGTLSGNIFTGVAGTSTLTMGTGNSNGTALLSGNLSDGTGTLALTQSNGTTTLSGTNTYSGATTISGGTLLVNGNSSGATGAVSVASGTTLGGNGKLGGSTTVATTINGTVAPGAASATIGMLTLTNAAGANISATGIYLADLNATTSDNLTLSGALTITTGATLNFNSLATPGAASYDLANYASETGTFNVTNLPSGYQLSYGATELDLVAVPEPATWVAGLLGLGALGFRLRRRVAGMFRRQGVA